MLSIPTPPRPISFNEGQASINSFLTCVALLTNSPLIVLSLTKLTNCSCATLVVITSNPAAFNASTPDSEIPSLAKIFTISYYPLRSNSLIISTNVPTLFKDNALYIDAR